MVKILNKKLLNFMIMPLKLEPKRIECLDIFIGKEKILYKHENSFLPYKEKSYQNR